MIGTLLGHYRVETALGAGGMGSVYLARDLALGRMAAIKVVGDAFEPSLRQRLLREAEASARLQHPAIATFYESGEADGHAFIAMEYVRGGTLRERIRSGSLPTVEAVGVASTVLEALNHAHAAGILHRDIKPENIMLAEGGTVKLLDFGLAQVACRETDDPATVTNLTEGRILGTVGYMSPEQLRGDAVDARSDIFALGAVLYEMLAGRPAFPGGSATERIAAILGREPDTLGPLVRPRSRPSSRVRFHGCLRTASPAHRRCSRPCASRPPVRQPCPCRKQSPSSTCGISPGRPSTTGSAVASPRA